MVWGYTTSKGVGWLHRIRGHLNAPKYCVILNESLLGTLDNCSLSPCLITLRHSSDSKCRSRLANAWFDEHHVLLLQWPSSSPYRNITEHVRERLDHYLYRHGQFSRNLNKLWVALQEERYALDIEFIRKLYDPIPDRIAAEKRVHGLYTRC